MKLREVIKLVIDAELESFFDFYFFNIATNSVSAFLS